MMVGHSVRSKHRKNKCTKVQSVCANAGKARAIETQGWLCTLLEALLL